MADPKSKSDVSNKPTDPKTEAVGDQPRLAEALKRILTTGVASAFMSEEGLKSALGDLKIPKEMLSAVLHSAGKTKDDIAGKVSQELINILRKIDFVHELSRFAEEHTFKISAEIDVVKKKKKPTHVSE